MMRIGFNPYNSSNTSFQANPASTAKKIVPKSLRDAINEGLQDALDNGLVKDLDGKVVKGGKVAK